MIVIGVDTGGTFTDFVFREGDRWDIYKTLSTPSNPSKAVIEGLKKISEEKAKAIVHGSTVATNAILERKGVKTALITNKGFEDIIEIGRQNRSRLYDLAYKKEPHIVSKELRFGVKQRTLCNGEILEELDMEGAKGTLEKIISAKVESGAVCFLFSYLNPAHEKKMKGLLEEARNNIAWALRWRSAISSRKIRPPLAASKAPFRSATAPVKLPFL